MARIGQALDKEWNEVAGSEAAAKAARRWGKHEPALAGLGSVQDALERRRDLKKGIGRHRPPGPAGPERRAGGPHVLQALLSGLVCLTPRGCGRFRESPGLWAIS